MNFIARVAGVGTIILVSFGAITKRLDKCLTIMFVVVRRSTCTMTDFLLIITNTNTKSARFFSKKKSLLFLFFSFYLATAFTKRTVSLRIRIISVISEGFYQQCRLYDFKINGECLIFEQI